jgi:hypothetical protein
MMMTGWGTLQYLEETNETLTNKSRQNSHHINAGGNNSTENLSKCSKGSNSTIKLATFCLTRKW